MTASNPSLAALFPMSCRLAGEPSTNIPPADFPAYLAAHPHACGDHPYLPDLAAIEYACHQLSAANTPFPTTVAARIINPTVQIIEVGWTGLPALLQDPAIKPERGTGLVLLYQPEFQAPVMIRTPDSHDLLALKLVMEDIPSKDAAAEAGVTVGRIDDILTAAARSGLILSPPSSLVRDPSFHKGPFADLEQSRVATFALQWHLTQACDLHCRHCYDRSNRSQMTFPQAIHVLDQLYDFCQAHHIHAQVSFTGGNPMLYPHFYELYQEAVDRGFLVAVLGNPMEDRYIERMLAIRQPEFYQVSLEGLRDHDDYIRGPGHFDRSLIFLDRLRAYGIYAMVMLTLTRANCDQVLPLAELLRDRADLFTFNRLAMVGEGAELASVEPERFTPFLETYLAAAAGNPLLSLKDNLFNLVLAQQERPLTGGCTGFGCGAAFNFVSVLPDGEVHACRKFPSPIGNIFAQSLGDIYHGAAALRYRTGSSACRDCELRPVCRGCPAVVHGFGSDVFNERDPYCFRDLTCPFPPLRIG